MENLRVLSARPKILVDPRGLWLQDPATGSIVGIPGPLGRARLVYALTTNISGGNLSLRYHPPHPAAERCSFGMSFDNVLPLGLGIVSGTLTINKNVVPPAADSSWSIGPVTVRGRALYASLSGGVDGTDYQLTFSATDTEGNIWPRTALCLCAATS